MSVPYISVGLITRGEPDIAPSGGYTLVSNLRIGDGFHWDREISARFAGEIRKLDEPQGDIHIVNTLPLEDYLVSVTASEMNPRAPVELLKAHAVISRSWALRKILYKDTACTAGKEREARRVITWEEADSHTGFDVCSDDHCQRYQGIPEHNMEEAEAAVAATRGEVLCYGPGDDRVADARFSKCCGGVTELFSSCWADDDPEYLISHADPWCASLRDMPGHEAYAILDRSLKSYDREKSILDWTEYVSKIAIADNIRRRYNTEIGIILHIEPIRRGPSGRITELKIVGNRGSITVGKELEIRRLLKRDCLRSSWFDVVADSLTGIVLHGHGWGHGVGLCQVGAAVMAARGKDYREILEFYYPGTRITKRY